LEIFADDVACSHGCTVGQLDEEALFYMRSRGIEEETARAMLMVGFASDAIEGIQHPSLRAKLSRLIGLKLGLNMEFSV